jgi:hypothetical protein
MTSSTREVCICSAIMVVLAVCWVWLAVTDV